MLRKNHNLFIDKSLVAVSERLKDFSLSIIRKKITMLKEDTVLQKKISIAFSGGNSPKIFFKLFANALTDEDLAYLEFFQVDERCTINTDYSLFNRQLIQKYFLARCSTTVKFNFIELLNKNNSPKKIAKTYSNEIRHFFSKNNSQSFDIVFLGVGNDGHTASIFPASNELLNAKNISEYAIATQAPTTASPHVPRITLSLKTINDADNILVLLSGQQKLDLLTKNINESLPIFHINSKANFFINNKEK
ncbi:6-phosphogluconolactonase [Lentisphaerota bacterium WC36G]|nr:6-phosphogluconolactonase [Lentisphaerae bacterium WC36]